MSPARRLLTATLTLAAAAASFVAVSPAASAAPVYSITGDVTGDGLRDRVALTDVGTRQQATCVALVKAGRADGGYDPAKPVTLDTPTNDDPDQFQVCPSGGVVSTAPRPAGNLLIAVYSDSVSFRASDVYSLTRRTVASGEAPLLSSFGEGQISRSFGVLDFDGDGTGDFWQQGTDQGDPSTMWQRRGTSFVEIYGTGPNPGVGTPGSGLQFVNLNRAGGTDALASTFSNGSDAPFAAVVDGRTGAVRTLVSGFGPVDNYTFGYRIASVDLNHDAYPDIAVTAVSDAGDLPPRYFVNRSQGGRFSFAEVQV